MFKSILWFYFLMFSKKVITTDFKQLILKALFKSHFGLRMFDVLLNISNVSVFVESRESIILAMIHDITIN